MRLHRKATAPRYKREEGVVSYLLASPLTSDAMQLTTTVVEIQPGGRQHLHSHLPEQIYYILSGSGQMTVGEERSAVRAGDCVFIGSGASHGLENDSGDVLRYFSAASPAFDRRDLESMWPLASEMDGGAA